DQHDLAGDLICLRVQYLAAILANRKSGIGKWGRLLEKSDAANAPGGESVEIDCRAVRRHGGDNQKAGLRNSPISPISRLEYASHEPFAAAGHRRRPNAAQIAALRVKHGFSVWRLDGGKPALVRQLDGCSVLARRIGANFPDLPPAAAIRRE